MALRVRLPEVPRGRLVPEVLGAPEAWAVPEAAEAAPGVLLGAMVKPVARPVRAAAPAERGGALAG
ncbi:hypothetical protein ACWEOZ_23820 [Actinoplanes sp. NPDC004185]